MSSVATGGEEFVVILSSADIAAAGPIAERIRNRVADVRVEGFGEPIRVTCSIGVATSDTLGVWGEHLIARADAAVCCCKVGSEPGSDRRRTTRLTEVRRDYSDGRVPRCPTLGTGMTP